MCVRELGGGGGGGGGGGRIHCRKPIINYLHNGLLITVIEMVSLLKIDFFLII